MADLELRQDGEVVWATMNRALGYPRRLQKLLAASRSWSMTSICCIAPLCSSVPISMSISSPRLMLASLS